jgi:hypothetical protein
MRQMVLVAGLVMMSGVAIAQNIPVKMGLWEGTTVLTAMGMTKTVVMQSCLTPETYEKSLSMLANPPAGCKFNNVKTGQGYALDASCTLSQGVTMEMHGTTTIADAEHTAAKVHSTMVMNGKTVESNFEGSSHFVKTDCGSVVPGKPVVQQK